MNLYLFNDNDSAAIYGIGTYIKELTHALEGSGIHVHIVHLHSVRPEFEIVKKTNQVEEWHIPEVRNHNTFSGSIQLIENYCRNVIYLFRLYVKDTKDLVFHFNFNLYQYLAKELKSVFDCKTVTTVHFSKWMLVLQGNLSLFHTLKSKPENQRNAHEQWLITTDEYENLLYKTVDKMIVLSNYTQNYLCSEHQLDPQKISVIPNGLEDISLEMETDREVLRRKWRISENEFVILFVGRLNPVKGLNFLIRAFREVLETIPDCRLIIAGNGQFDSYMVGCEDIYTKITWTGLLSKNKLYELYSIADIGVMPSFHEQCSYVAIEMMRHDIPLIVSTSTGLNEMVEEGESGLHVPVIEYPDKMDIDTTLLTEKILYLLQNSEERIRLGQNARKRYEERYSADVFHRKMLEFYESLTGSIGLFSGKMGVAIYWFHCARVFPDEDYEKQAQILLNEIQESINKDTYLGYANGLAGIGSALCYLFRERFIELDCEDFFVDFDSYFFNQVCFAEHTDLSCDTGIIGIGYYLLNRLKDKPTCDSMASLKLRHLLLLIQNVIFARLGMNGYTYPFMKSEILPKSVVVDIKRFLGKMSKTGLCPELTRKAIAIIDEMGHSGQTVFAELEDAYNNKNSPVFQSLMAKIAESPKESLAKKLAILQLQDMSLPPWWELF